MALIIRRLRQLFRSRRIEEDLAQEIETHRALVQDHQEARDVVSDVR